MVWFRIKHRIHIRFVDHHMKPEVRKLQIYVEDTPHFFRSIEEIKTQGPLPPNVFPVSMDV